MEERRRPVIGGFYRHFKNRLYQLLHVAVHADTEEELAIYQALYGDFRIYARPLKDFMGEVDRKKYPTAVQRYRFVQVMIGTEGDGERKSQQSLEAASAETDGRRRAEETEEIVLTGGVSWKETRHRERWDREDASREERREREPLAKDKEEGGIQPKLLEFLDEETYQGKLRVFCEIMDEDLADEHMLSAIAASMDLSLGSESREEQCGIILDNLKTRERYECTRLPRK